jgi:hypothetical protein
MAGKVHCSRYVYTPSQQICNVGVPQAVEGKPALYPLPKLQTGNPGSSVTCFLNQTVEVGLGSPGKQVGIVRQSLTDSGEYDLPRGTT